MKKIFKRLSSTTDVFRKALDFGGNIKSNGCYVGWKRITFKNGNVLQISQDTANKLQGHILGKSGAKKFQIFGDKSGNMDYMINIEEVLHIY